MADIKDILENLPSKQLEISEEENPMGDAEYIEKSSKVIQDALSKGMDVLQLENGDIVTTALKVVETKYRWDYDTNQMVKVSSRSRRKAPNK